MNRCLEEIDVLSIFEKDYPKFSKTLKTPILLFGMFMYALINSNYLRICIIKTIIFEKFAKYEKLIGSLLGLWKTTLRLFRSFLLHYKIKNTKS